MDLATNVEAQLIAMLRGVGKASRGACCACAVRDLWWQTIW
jgi:hypothetical protein